MEKFHQMSKLAGRCFKHLDSCQQIRHFASVHKSSDQDSASELLNRGIDNASKALQAPDPSPSHRTVKWFQEVQKAIVSAGYQRLDGHGMRAYILGETPGSDHGYSIVRSLAGPVGWAKGADVYLLDPNTSDHPSKVTTIQERRDLEDLESQLQNGDMDEDAIVAYGKHVFVDNIYRKAAELFHLGTLIPAEDSHCVKVATISWSKSVNRIIQDVIARTHNTNDEKTTKSLLVNYRPSVEKLQAALETAQSRADIEKARLILAREVTSLNEKGFIIFASAGNSFHRQMPPHSSQHGSAHTTGMFHVGATFLGRGAQPTRLTPFSAEGADLACLGAGLPVGLNPDSGECIDNEGTSLAAPQLAGMVLAMANSLKLSHSELIDVLKARAEKVKTADERLGLGSVHPWGFFKVDVPPHFSNE